MAVEARVLQEVRLTAIHVPTGNTRHTVGGVPMSKPSTLRIARYVDDPGYYLLYLDEHGHEQTDTWHQSLDDAHHQATFEFGVQPQEWTVLQSDA
jgi:hypothetical protein